MAAVSVTHHVTAGLLMISFVFWWVLELLLRRKRENEATSLAVMAGSGAALLAATVLNPGNTLGSYLGAIIESSGTALTRSSRASSPSSCSRTPPGSAPPPGNRWP